MSFVFLTFSCILGGHCLGRGGPADVPNWQNNRPQTTHTYVFKLQTGTQFRWGEPLILTHTFFSCHGVYSAAFTVWPKSRKMSYYMNLLFLFLFESGGLGEHETVKRGSLYLLLERIRRFGFGKQSENDVLTFFFKVRYSFIAILCRQLVSKHYSKQLKIRGEYLTCTWTNYLLSLASNYSTGKYHFINT